MNSYTSLIKRSIAPAIVLALLLGTPCVSKQYPFTAEENSDGARFVRHILNQAGFACGYVPAKSFPDSEFFTTIPKPVPGSVAWWKEFMAVFGGKEASGDIFVLTATGKKSLKELEKKYGPVKWFRYGTPPKDIADPPKEKLDLFDKKLAALAPFIGGFPPRVKSEEQLEKVKGDWKKAVEEFSAVIKSFPKSPAMEYRIAELYRFGHNLDMSGAWKNSEAHFQKAIFLSPRSVEAHLGLGTLYVNTHMKYATMAENLFTKAIALSQGEEFPVGALSGLFFAYYYQARFKEAVAVADRYLKHRPDNKGMKKLRDIARTKASGR
jgi:hypothetical protein